MFSKLFINGTVAVVSLVMMTIQEEEENIELCSAKGLQTMMTMQEEDNIEICL